MTTNNKRRSFEFLSFSLVLGLVSAIAALAFFAWLTDEVLEGDLRNFDEVTRVAVHQIASPAMTTTMRGISFLGSALFLTIAAILVVVLFVLRKWQREAKLFGITMIGASILNTTLKLVFQRPRPVPFFNLTAPESYSFPSGHSLASCCFYGALAALLTARMQNRRLKLFTWIVGVVMFLLIGLSRIYLGVHYTTDVIAGFVGALIWIMTVRFVDLELARRKRKKLLRQQAS
jgi:membrane-associated phospholipid phosphatase